MLSLVVHLFFVVGKKHHQLVFDPWLFGENIALLAIHSHYMIELLLQPDVGFVKTPKHQNKVLLAAGKD